MTQELCNAVAQRCPDELERAGLAVYPGGGFQIGVHSRWRGGTNNYFGTLDGVVDPVEYLSRVLKGRLALHGKPQ